MPLPDIWVLRKDGSLDSICRFGYLDFKMRLGDETVERKVWLQRIPVSASVAP